MQDTVQIIPTPQFPDSPRVAASDSAFTPNSGTDSVFRRPRKRVVPLKADSSADHSQPGLSVLPPGSTPDDSHADLQIITKSIETDTPTEKAIDLYKGHALEPVHEKPEIIGNLSPIWFFPVLLFTIAVITWLRVFYSKYFSQIFQALMNNNITNQIVRDENIVVQRASVYLSFTFNLTAALFLYQVSTYLQWDMGGIGSGLGRFLFFVIIVSAAYAMKFLILKICGWLFDQDREMATYIFNIFLINHLLGILLIPMVALLAYNQLVSPSVILITSLILISAAFLYRVIRGILIGLAVPGFSPLYLFLYLCTLEIAPLTVLIRILVQ